MNTTASSTSCARAGATVHELPRDSADDARFHLRARRVDRLDGGIDPVRDGQSGARDRACRAGAGVRRHSAVAIAGRITPPGTLEGGDLIWLDEDTVAVGRGYRTNAEGVRQLRALVGDSVEVIEVPLPHWHGQSDVMHLMSLISPIDRDLAVVYSRLLPVPFREWLLERGMRLVEVPDEEFETMGTNVLALAPRRCLMLDGQPADAASARAIGLRGPRIRGLRNQRERRGWADVSHPAAGARILTIATVKDLVTINNIQIMNHKLIARREWLKRVGAAAVVPPRMLLPLISRGPASTIAAQSPSAAVGSTVETLTAAEAETLGAIAARLIPTDSSGPGATEARAAQYIDRALGGALAPFRETYRAGLAAIDRHAQSTRGNAFARLSAADQDALLRDVERNAVDRLSRTRPRSSISSSSTRSRARSAIPTTAATRTSPGGI